MSFSVSICFAVILRRSLGLLTYLSRNFPKQWLPPCSLETCDNPFQFLMIFSDVADPARPKVNQGSLGQSRFLYQIK
jgi:hypothetical protein